jgi:eukaryotic-like serine/threonine-protein kinase
VLVDDLPLEVSAADKGRIPGAVTFRADDFLPTLGSKNSSARVHSGTVGYVDPETLRTGALATPASDIYALGVVLFECVSGQHPAAVAAAAGEGLKQEVLDGREPAPTLASVVPGAPASLSSLVERMLAPAAAGRPRTADWVAIELERIRAEVAGTRRTLPPEASGPFRGLGRFEEADRDIYFGRSSEIAAAIELMRSHGLVALVGPSGSGKSSLARAGVLPRVREGAIGRGLAQCDVAVIAPANDPRRAVLEALAALPEPPFAMTEGRDMLPAAVVAALADRAQVSERGTLLFVDQLEELVTMESLSFSASRKWTIELLVALAQTSVAGVRALVTARRDLLEPLLAYEGLGKALMRGTLLVEPMTDATWDDVIEQALAAYGYELESPELAAELAKQLRGTVGAMPLVQFALTELWAKRNTADKKVTRAALDEIGGIAGSLERHAEATLKELLRAGFGSETEVRDLLLPLTTPHGTRASVPLEALVKKDERGHAMVTALEGARLLVSGAGGVTLAHDALLVQWARLRGWLADARDRRLLTEALERDAQMWTKDPASTSLWVGRRLEAAAELRRDVADEAVRFLTASRRASRRARELRVAAVTVLLAMAAIIAMVYVRSVKADRAAAVERAALEQSKASVEQSRRIELERAQAELDGRQQKIDALMAELSKAEDPKAIQELQRQLKEAQTGAHDSQDKIAAVIPNRPQASSKPALSAAPPAPSASVVRPKIQREP